MRSLVLLCFALCICMCAGHRCSLFSPPALMISPSGVIYQETLPSLDSRIGLWLDMQNVSTVVYSDTWMLLPAQSIANDTVMSGWIRPLNRFGQCQNEYGD